MTTASRPFARPLARAALLVAAWGAVVLFSVTQYILTYSANGGAVSWGGTLRVSVMQWLPWLVFAPVVLVAADRAPLRGRRRATHLALHVALTFGLAAAIVAATYLVRALAGAPITRPFRVELLRSVNSIALVYWLLVAAAHAADAVRRAREREGQVARLEGQLSEARLAVLQAQLHPHFLFNTLHGVASLVHEDPDGAEDMLAALGDLLRATLGRGERHEVALREDVGFLERYLEIHKMRLGDRLEYELAIAPETLDLLVPSFIVQPLAENAIRHGIASRRAGGRLEVRAEVVGDRLRLTVADDGPGPGGDGASGTGIGLANTRARLAQLHGDAHRFTIAPRAEGGTVVTIELPVRRAS